VPVASAEQRTAWRGVPRFGGAARRHPKDRPVTSLPLLPGAEELAVDAGPVGVLLSHGFTGMPSSLRPWAESVAAAGHSVRLPLLPGHGTSWRH
jgi:alpha-beta hydrolase superfamily lysophospholipase